jgi:hypothetical protein
MHIAHATGDRGNFEPQIDQDPPHARPEMPHYPLWYATSCPCGKEQSCLRGELAEARQLALADAGAADAVREGGGRRLLQLQLHLSQVPRPPSRLLEPASASAGDMVGLLQQLIAIPSVNPDQVLSSGGDPTQGGVCGEYRIAQELARQFRELGAEVVLEDCSPSWLRRDEVAGSFEPRMNIYAIVESIHPGAKWVAIDAHLDTVMVSGMQPFGAFDGTLTEDGKLHGRGACDTKATFAIVLTILRELIATEGSVSALPVNLVMCGTAGEETPQMPHYPLWYPGALVAQRS